MSSAHFDAGQEPFHASLAPLDGLKVCPSTPGPLVLLPDALPRTADRLLVHHTPEERVEAELRLGFRLPDSLSLVSARFGNFAMRCFAAMAAISSSVMRFSEANRHPPTCSRRLDAGTFGFRGRCPPPRYYGSIRLRSRFRGGRPPKFPCRTLGTRHVPMPRSAGRVAKRLRRVRVGFGYHDPLDHGRPSVRSFEAYIRDFTSFGSFLFRDWASCASVAPPRSQPSYRHVVFFAVQTPFILLALPSFAWRTMRLHSRHIRPFPAGQSHRPSMKRTPAAVVPAGGRDKRVPPGESADGAGRRGGGGDGAHPPGGASELAQNVLPTRCSAVGTGRFVDLARVHAQASEDALPAVLPDLQHRVKRLRPAEADREVAHDRPECALRAERQVAQALVRRIPEAEALVVDARGARRFQEADAGSGRCSRSRRSCSRPARRLRAVP